MTEHAVSRRTYFKIFLILIILAAATALIAEFDLGRFNVTVALGIAFIKAGLVAIYFMHLRESRSLVWLVVIVSIVWLAILITLTFADYATRSWTRPSV